MKIRSVLTLAVYKKALLLSSTGKHIYATGEVINLMSTDCERIFEFIIIVNQAWACWFQVLIGEIMIIYLDYNIFRSSKLDVKFCIQII